MSEPTKDATQAEINAAILGQLQEMRNEMAAMKNRPSLFGRVAKILWAWRHIIITFILGMAAGAAIPFVSGRMPNPPVIVRPVSSLQQIVNQSPENAEQRKMLAKSYRNTASEIATDRLADPHVALTTLRVEATPVFQRAEWKETAQRLEKYVGDPSGVTEIADKFNEIAEAFEKSIFLRNE